jgi:hypothetical protein
MERHGRWHGIVIHAIADRDPVGAYVRQRRCLTGRLPSLSTLTLELKSSKSLMKAGSFLARLRSGLPR